MANYISISNRVEYPLVLIINKRIVLIEEEMKMSTLSCAIKIAAMAHDGQLDKAGQSYILHPLRVMMSLDTDEEKIVGVLHDVIEDTFITEARLKGEGFSEEITEAIKSVTRNKNENYWDFIRRSMENEIGREVKLADVKDNMDWTRIISPSETDMKRMQKYQQAYYMLTK